MGVSVKGGLCPGCLCLGGVSVQESLCPGGLCQGRSLSRGSLSGGVSVQGGLCLGGLSQGGPHLGDVCSGVPVLGGFCPGFSTQGGLQWLIYVVKFWMHTPPGGPNSFNFMQFLGKFGKIVCWRSPGELAPPPRGNRGSATGLCLRGDICPGGLCPGVSVWGISLQRSLSRGSPSMHHRSHHQVPVLGGLCPGISVQGVSQHAPQVTSPGPCLGGSLSGVLYLGGLCLRGSLPGSLYQGVISVQEVSV